MMDCQLLICYRVIDISKKFTYTDKDTDSILYFGGCLAVIEYSIVLDLDFTAQQKHYPTTLK